MLRDEIFRKPEAGSREPEAGSRKPEAGSRKPEAGSHYYSGQMRPFLPLVLALTFAPVSVSSFALTHNGGQAAAPVTQQAKPQDSAAYYFLVARQLEDEGKTDEAIAALKQALTLEPKSAELRAELAGLYARQNRAVEALTTAEEALTFDPANREANRLVGSIYTALAEQGRPLRPGDDPTQYAAKAIAALEKARHPSRGDLGIELTIGRLYLRSGQAEKAIGPLERVFMQQPEYADGGLLYATAQEESGRVDEAIATLEETIKHTPAFFRAHVKVIELLERQRRWKEAAAAYARAQGINPKADLTEGHAMALLNSGATGEAEKLLQSALAKKTAPDARLLYLLAESQRRSKNYEAASETVRRLRTAFPDDTRGLLVEAQLQLTTGQKDKAIETLGALVKRMPDQPLFVYQYAQLLEDADRFDEAEKVLRARLDREPKDANALNALGYMFAERGQRLDEAVTLVERALKIEPGNPSFLDSLGWAYFKQGQLRQAEKPLVEAAEKMPANSVIQDHLGDLRYRQQRYADAIAAWERALAGDGESISRSEIEQKLREARLRVAKQ